ncbi:MAG: integrase core domain-containing protein [bacterium]
MMEEGVWDQKLETFLRLHEIAFEDFGGVPQIVRQDNLKAAVVRACLYDPNSKDVDAAFARHWGFTPLPIRPRTPQENGKQERSGGYVKDNALKGRRFDSLQEQNEFLKWWNRTVARLRIHGTTRQQVWLTSRRSKSRHCVRWPPSGYPASPAVSGRFMRTVTSKSRVRSTRCR